ncbi:hypothetical protein BGZ95_011824 [Linnemannia exigua]|uniref:Tetraspanin n=1 Tax=Linnemannia exigua TaxID=604196 RepID=A0AAD4D9E3_9FUNG|nr:hypothetical protein BGZ95_011824 [Linnemannia exigua]
MVFLISLIALVLGGFSLWATLRQADADQTSKISGYVTTGIYGLLGASGLFSVMCKVYPLAKNFSVLWWTVTVLSTLLNIASIVIAATSQKENVRAVCRVEIRADPAKYNPLTLEDDVDSCYKTGLIIIGVALAVQCIIMSLCGWVASRYVGEVKHMHDHENNTQAQIQMAYPKA